MLPVLFGAARAEATLEVLEPTEALVRRADVVALGTIEAVTPAWEGRRIVSRVTAVMHDSLKGDAGRVVTLHVPGGSVGGVAMRVSGTPTFTAGERSVFFLSKRGDQLRLAGGLQSKLPVLVDSRGNESVRWVGADATTTYGVTLPALSAYVREHAKTVAP